MDSADSLSAQDRRGPNAEHQTPKHPAKRALRLFEMAEVDFTQLSQEELDAVLEGPAMPPPDGEVSIFDDPPNQNGLAIGVFTACTAVVVICLAIRLYAKLGLMKKAQVQEYLLVAAFVCLNLILPRFVMRLTV